MLKISQNSKKDYSVWYKFVFEKDENESCLAQEILEKRVFLLLCYQILSTFLINYHFEDSLSLLAKRVELYKS